MNLRLLRLLLIFGAFAFADLYVAPPSAEAAVTAKASRRRKKKSGRRRRKKKSRTPAVRLLWRSDDGSQWVRKGARNIIVARDSAGIVRAMTPFSGGWSAGYEYADAINRYAGELAPDSVRVYALIAPTQGEFYMPDIASTRGNERSAIAAAMKALGGAVTPVMVCDTLAAHAAEHIYSYTDHHWAPLGAYYASKVLAEAAGVDFRPLDVYTPDTVRNYVGTMAKFSGDPEVGRAPENFVFYRPPVGYDAQFVDYRMASGHVAGQSGPHRREFFVEYADGNSSAYCTFMGGDYHTVKVTSTGGTPGRRLLIVKDSFGNAMAPALFGSFEEVHVIDHRYYPHNLADYVRRENITDLLFINSVPLAFASSAASHLRRMLTNPTCGHEFNNEEGN